MLGGGLSSKKSAWLRFECDPRRVFESTVDPVRQTQEKSGHVNRVHLQKLTNFSRVCLYISIGRSAANNLYVLAVPWSGLYPKIFKKRKYV